MAVSDHRVAAGRWLESFPRSRDEIRRQPVAGAIGGSRRFTIEAHALARQPVQRRVGPASLAVR